MKPFGRTFEWGYCYFSISQKEISIFWPLLRVKMLTLSEISWSSFLIMHYHQEKLTVITDCLHINKGICRSCLKNETKLKQLQDHNNVIISPFNNFLKSKFCGVVKRIIWGCFVPFSCRRKQAKNLNLQRVQKGKRYTCSLHLLDVINFSLCLLDCKTVRISAKSSMRE